MKTATWERAAFDLCPIGYGLLVATGKDDRIDPKGAVYGTTPKRSAGE